MCLVFHTCAFDDVIKFEYLKSYNLIISITERAFKIFPCFTGALRLTKQNSKNITDLTFNVYNDTVLWFHFFGIWLSVKFRKFLIINNFSQVLHFLILPYKEKLKVQHESTVCCTAFRVALLRCPFY